MERLFLSLVNRSVAAGWLILIVAALRLVLKKAPVPKAAWPWFWTLAAARLACPYLGRSPLSLLPSAEVIPQAALDGPSFQVHSGVAAFNAPVNGYLSSHVYEGVTRPVGYTRSIIFSLAAVWLAGIILLALAALISYLRLRRRVSGAVPQGDGVWVCGGIPSPFLLGVIKPRIYLPEGLDEGSRIYVLAHERAHIRRRDHLAKPLGGLLLAVYWFNPLVWLAYGLFCRDVELACDERVVSELGAACKKPYSAALLACSVRRSGLTACPLAFGEAGVKERVKNVLHYKKPALWTVWACLAGAALLAVCFLTDPVAEPPEDKFSFASLGTSQPEEPVRFAAGALLYQNPYLGYCPVAGDFSPILYGGDELTLTLAGESFTYRLEETVSMAWDNLYDYFPYLAEEEEYFGALLTDHNDLVITARFYGDGSGDPGPSVWTIQKEGGGQRWWLYYGGRLFALIDLDNTFPFLGSGVLWTYEPDRSDLLPVRFDVTASVFAGPDALVSLDPREDEWTEHLEVEAGQTVYWKPALDEDGKPRVGTGLRYCFEHELDGKPRRAEEALTIRPAMDYAGLYGGVTYGVSNNWLGAASSQARFTSLTVDGETGELAAGIYTGGGPYELGDVGRAQGTAGALPETADAGE